MIPKKLFFIWIGRDIPNYVHFSMNAFKKMNDGFDTELVHIPQLFGSNNADVIEVKEKLKDVNSIYYKLYNREWKRQNLSHSRKSRDIWFTDVFRVHLINKYGGIYLDCDTYPIKPFDNKLLSKRCFKTLSVDVNDRKCKWSDIYFMGSEKNKYSHENASNIECTVFKNNKIYNKQIPLEFEKNRSNFFNCINDFDTKYCMKNEYILHFKALEWK